MSKELIERLRADAESTDDIGLCADAADRIEELERERDAAFAMSRCECEANECCASLVKLHNRIEELEHKLACAEYESHMRQEECEIARDDRDAVTEALKGSKK